MRTLLAVAALALTVAQAQALVGHLAGGRPFDLSLKITTTQTGPVAAGQAGIQDPKRRAERRFIVK